jgi:cell division protein FtsN
VIARQRGGFAIGLVAGLLVGLAVALAVALYITKAPNPFVNKVPQRTAEQDTQEIERNRTWDPNAPLGGKGAVAAQAAAAAAATAASAIASSSPIAPAADPTTPAAASASAGAAPVVAATTAAAASTAARAPIRDPAAILAGTPTPGGPAADPFVYFVQTGAFTRNEDAEQQRARLALMGLTARITEREQAGRTMYRVRLGPYPSRDEADNQQTKLQEQSIETQLVRVEKP